MIFEFWAFSPVHVLSQTIVDLSVSLTFLFRVFSWRWKSTAIPSSSGDGGPLIKKLESLLFVGESQWVGELLGLG